jgi:hypothetical protein
MRLAAWRRWQEAAGPWRGWAICPALTVACSPQPPCDVASTTVLDLSDLLASTGTAVVLDIEPCLGVRSAAAANARGLGHVVLVLPRWPHTDAILPTATLAATLVACSRHLREPNNASNVVFVLDGEREGSVWRPVYDVRVDNRYALGIADLPNLQTLRGAGIQRLVKVTVQQ